MLGMEVRKQVCKVLVGILVHKQVCKVQVGMLVRRVVGTLARMEVHKLACKVLVGMVDMVGMAGTVEGMEVRTQADMVLEGTVEGMMEDIQAELARMSERMGNRSTHLRNGYCRNSLSRRVWMHSSKATRR